MRALVAILNCAFFVRGLLIEPYVNKLKGFHRDLTRNWWLQPVCARNPNYWDFPPSQKPPLETLDFSVQSLLKNPSGHGDDASPRRKSWTAAPKNVFPRPQWWGKSCQEWSFFAYSRKLLAYSWVSLLTVVPRSFLPTLGVFLVTVGVFFNLQFNQKNPRAHKIKSALPPPPRKPKSPPPSEEFYGHCFSCRKNAFFQVPIKLAHPFPAPESRAKHFTDTRIFLIEALCTYIGEIQKGTAGRGRELRHFTTICDILRHFATSCDTLRHFMTISVAFLTWHKTS